MSNKFVGLIILDGFGLREEDYGNAIKLANPINFNNYLKNFPSCKLDASGEAVGLPHGLMGNSEVGHMHIGAGRVVDGMVQKINKAIKTGEIKHNKEILNAFENVKSHNSDLHIMGILSDIGVHGNMNHMFALLDMAKENEIKNIYIHCFLDGRDSFREDGVRYLRILQDKIDSLNNVNIKIASVMGRAYAMNRETDWTKTEIAYKCLVLGNAEHYSNDVFETVKESYNNQIYDEFVEPTLILDNGLTHTIHDYDSVIFYNYREDRARKITMAMIEDFDVFPTIKLNNVYFVGFSKYDKRFVNEHPAFEMEDVTVNLSSVVSKSGLKQFKIAETTKYAHVTYFLNGGIEKPYKGEERFLVETLKGVNFDEVPAMRAMEITDKAIEEINTNKYSLMVLNYSNCDMIGHTGNLNATIEAVKVLDKELKRLVDAIIKIGGVAIITADHGNAEDMIGDGGRVLTDHTLNKVPFIIINSEVKKLKNGSLANIAPTILQLLNIEKPAEFTKESLIVN